MEPETREDRFARKILELLQQQAEGHAIDRTFLWRLEASVRRINPDHEILPENRHKLERTDK